MDDLFQNDSQIKSYATIQRYLLNLQPNASDEDLQKFINSIPQNFLTNKEDLMMICQIFAHYAQFTTPSIRGNALKLFEKIKDFLQTYLHDESYFLCRKLGGLFYFKLLMYNWGLINIDHIIMSIEKNSSPQEAEYFLPEIIKERPEIFEKQIKFKIICPYSSDYIQQLEEIRKKHIQWILTSCNYHDPIYQEIETNKLRLSIKTDDIDTFQKILSNSNLSVDSTIEESIYDNYLMNPQEIPLIELAINYDAAKIFKFLIMNNVTISEKLDFTAISLYDSEIIHTLESLMKDEFIKNALFNAIGCWNVDFHEYLIDTTYFDYIEKSEVTSEVDLNTIIIVYSTVFSCNFIFFDDFLLPFLRRNPRFLNENFNEVVYNSLSDCSCFFLSEFLKDKRMNINYRSQLNVNRSILSMSIFEGNSMAIEKLFENENLEINLNEFRNFTPYQIACKVFADLKVLDLFLNNKKFDVNLCQNNFRMNSFEFAVAVGNFYFAQKILENKSVVITNTYALLNPLKNNKLMAVKIFLMKLAESNSSERMKSLILRSYLPNMSAIIKLFKELGFLE